MFKVGDRVINWRSGEKSGLCSIEQTTGCIGFIKEINEYETCFGTAYKKFVVKYDSGDIIEHLSLQLYPYPPYK